MKDINSLLMLALSLTICSGLFPHQTTTVTFKQDPNKDKDVLIWDLNTNCILNNQSQTPAYLYYSEIKEIHSTRRITLLKRT